MADSKSASPCKFRTLTCLTLVTVTSGCALQSQYSSPSMEMQGQWADVQQATLTPQADHPFPDRWWTALRDPAIDALIVAALRDNPTVDEVISRTDEARAMLEGARAQRLPSIQASASDTRQQGAATKPGETMTSDVADIGLGISYEIDLFGRVRESTKAIENRLAARTAETEGARLKIAAQVANDVIALRACMFSQQVRDLEVDSRMQALDLTRRRVSAGVDARVEESRALNSLASARTEAALLNQECEQQTLALYVLMGLRSEDVRSILLNSSESLPETTLPFMPAPPRLPVSLPATVLTHHPDLIVVDREAAAAWSEVNVARVDRLPRIDLGALLTGNWLRAAGSTLSFTTWSIGPTLSAPLFDGGAGASNVNAAEARYRAAVARLRQTVRRIVQDITQALAFEDSSRVRLSSAQEALAADRDLFIVTERRWHAGATSLFDLEEARRQRISAEDATISAMRDHVQAWIEVMKAIGAITSPLHTAD